MATSATPPAPTRPILLLVLGLLMALLTACAHAEVDDDREDADVPQGRIAATSGPVHLSRGIASGEQPRPDDTLVNWPLASQDRLITDDGARAELDLGSIRVRLGERSLLQLERLDSAGIELRLVRGTLSVWVRRADGAGRVRVSSPLADIRPMGASLFRVDAPDASGQPAHGVTTWRDGVLVEQRAGTLRLMPGQRAELHAEGGWRLGVPTSDAFARWGLDTSERSADRPPEREWDDLPGVETLGQHGRWERTPEWGWVWIPVSVQAGWEPYREGRWTVVEPWGRVWVDRSVWGFAPFFYGRWVLWHGRWSWIPGRDRARHVTPPVYRESMPVPREWHWPAPPRRWSEPPPQERWRPAPILIPRPAPVPVLPPPRQDRPPERRPDPRPEPRPELRPTPAPLPAPVAPAPIGRPQPRPEPPPAAVTPRPMPPGEDLRRRHHEQGQPPAGEDAQRIPRSRQ